MRHIFEVTMVIKQPTEEPHLNRIIYRWYSYTRNEAIKLSIDAAGPNYDCLFVIAGPRINDQRGDGNYIICIIAGTLIEAQRFARANFWESDEWFFPMDEDELHMRTNFHTVIVGTAGMNVPSSYFDRLLTTAKKRGKIGRV